MARWKFRETDAIGWAPTQRNSLLNPGKEKCRGVRLSTTLHNSPRTGRGGGGGGGGGGGCGGGGGSDGEDAVAVALHQEVAEAEDAGRRRQRRRRSLHRNGRPVVVQLALDVAQTANRVETGQHGGPVRSRRANSSKTTSLTRGSQSGSISTQNDVSTTQQPMRAQEADLLRYP